MPTATPPGSPMKNEILLIGPLLESVMDLLETSYIVHRYYDADDPEHLLTRVADTITAVVTDGGRGVEAAVLAKLPKARIVAVYGVGVDAVDLDYCRQAGIAVTNTPDVLSGDVADLAIGLMLAVSRNMIEADAYARSGRWQEQGAMALQHRMFGKSVGILGMGSIGIQIARRLEGFDMDVAYCNRRKRSDVSNRYYASPVEMASEVDFLIIAAAASTSTEKIIDAEILQALGPNGYLINVSRGSLVDEDALIAALEQKMIKGAGLDVFAIEPNVPDALCKLNNVVLQPHQASATHETRKAMGMLVVENLSRFFDERPLLTRYQH